MGPPIHHTLYVGEINLGEVQVVINWGKALQVAFVGFSGVFVGLILLEICVNLLAMIVRIIERSSISK
jgi:hypothetical protein